MKSNSSKILFLTPELPYPPVSGGKLKSWKLLEFLSQQYQVSVATILKENDEDHVKEFIQKSNIDRFIFAPVKKARNSLNLIKSYLAKIPLNLYRTHSAYFKQKIIENIDQYDMVISDHYEVFQFIPKTYKGKVILHEHNAYYLMWERYAKDKKHSLIYRAVSFMESRRVKQLEKQYCQHADRVFASPNDIDTLESIGVDRDKCRYTYHLGDDTQLKLPSIDFDQTNKSLLYVGSLRWEANVDGLLWFFEQVWPGLIQSHPSLTLTIVGHNPDPRLLKASENEANIKFTGFVDELESYYKNNRVYIAPLRFGAGMKVKVLNAMCRGIPTVTTSVGCEGMTVTDKKHLMIADESSEMIHAISELLDNKILWESLENNSRQLIQEKYTWKALFKDMKVELDELLVNPSKES